MPHSLFVLIPFDMPGDTFRQRKFVKIPGEQTASRQLINRVVEMDHFRSSIFGEYDHLLHEDILLDHY